MEECDFDIMYNSKELLTWRHECNSYITLHSETKYQSFSPLVYNLSSNDTELVNYILNICGRQGVIVPEIDLYDIENGYVSDVGVIFSAEKFPFSLSMIDFSTHLSFQDIKKYQHTNIDFIDYECIFIFKAGKRNFGHLITEMLPKLLFLIKNIDISKYVLIVPTLDKVRDVFFKTISILEAAFNVKLKLYEMSTPLVQCRKLSYLGPLTRHNKFKSIFVREFAFKIKESIAGHFGRDICRNKIFVSRKSDLRPIVNLNHVEEYFCKNGFDIVYPEQYDFFDQIRIFSSCSHVAGFLGAGMSNIMFSNSSCKILLLDPGLHDFFFWDLSVLMEQKFHWFFNDLFRFESDKVKGPFEIDIDKLVSAKEFLN